MFDIKKVWKLGGKNKDDDANAFRWKNLNLLEESIGMCWITYTGKNIFDTYKFDVLKIIKSADKNEIHKLVSVILN